MLITGANAIVGAVDEDTNLYLTGGFSGSLSLDLPGISTTLESASVTSEDVFLISLRSGQVDSPFIVSPGSGGNAGFVTLLLEQSFPIRNPELFSSAETRAELVCNGASVLSQAVSVESDGNGLFATFNLSGQPIGSCDVVLTGSGGESLASVGGFEIVEGVEPRVWADISGREAIRIERPQTFSILYGNEGNVDALLVPLTIVLPSAVTWELKTELADVPLPEGETYIIDPSEVPYYNTVGDSTVISLILPVVRAGSSGSVEISVQTSEASDFTIQTWAGALAGEPRCTVRSIKKGL